MQNLPSLPDDISNVDVIGAWDEAAEEFARFFARDDEFWHTNIINPRLLDLVGEATGKTVLDLGCGEGHVSRQLADMTRRDIRIIAVDASAKMIQIAEEKSAAYVNCLTFQRSDAGDLAGIRDDSFDIAICNMALMDIKNYRQALHEVSRTLKPRGIFVFSILHPCFFTPGSEWLWEDGDITAWKVDNYHLGLAWKSLIKSSMKNQTYYFHRTLEDYCSTLCECGFAIVGIREPIPSKKVLEIRPMLARELKRGGFLIVKSVLLEKGVGSRTAAQANGPDKK